MKQSGRSTGSNLLLRWRKGVDWVLRQRPLAGPAKGPDPAILPDLKVLVTANEAFPEFERLVLRATKRITCGFRIFDPSTTLMSPDAQAVGRTWEDLIADALRRGVAVKIYLSDFDPIAAPTLHRKSWTSVRCLRDRAVAEGCADLLHAEVCLHPAQSGYPYRLAAAPMARKSLRDMAGDLNAETAERRDALLRDAPTLARFFRRRADGKLRLARSVIPPLRPVTHHQKVAVIDGHHLYIGGLDLDDRRADDKRHRQTSDQTWADVQVSLTGPIAAQAEAHLLAFRDEVSGARPPADRRPGLLRTLSRSRSGLSALRATPKPMIDELCTRTTDGVRGASMLIYLETQFLRDLHFARKLAQRARIVPDLGIIVVLPAAPEDLAFAGARGLDMRFGEHLQARCIEIVSHAFGDRATFVCPAQMRGCDPDGTRAVLQGAPIIYVHSKVSIFDDRLGVVSSANLNGRSHRWDTEAGVALTDPGQVCHLRDRVMRHWLPADPAPDLLDPRTAPQAWRDLATANADRKPPDRDGFLLPYPLDAPRRFGRPVPFMTQDVM